jgi:arylsulfatase A-like enzyme
VFFLADDQGWNDVGWQSSDLESCTPHLSSLAEAGIVLTKYYGMHVCTPSRAALLTGMYTIHTGMQHSIVTGNRPYALPLDLTLMPAYLKEVRSLVFCRSHKG